MLLCPLLVHSYILVLMGKYPDSYVNRIIGLCSVISLYTVVCCSLIEELESSLSGLVESFPLFSYSVWKIIGHLHSYVPIIASD